jgi:hypothetical protein
MSVIDIVGFLGIVALAVVVGLIGGMRLSRWAVRREQRAWRIAQERRSQPFLRRCNLKLLG